MGELSFVDIAWMLLTISCVQFLLFYLTEAIKKSMKDRKDNTIYELHVNDEFIGDRKLKRCKDFYEDMYFESRKSAVIEEKSRKFFIKIDVD